ncbi:MAG: DUF5320 domain-containing protein [Acidobacteriaceae bacterium]
MPFRDGTGPLGQGPRSGWGAGFCGGPRSSGSTGAIAGRGLGMGRGGQGGRGRRNQFFATGLRGWQRAAGTAPVTTAATEQQEIIALKNQIGSLQATLEQMSKRAEELEAKSK